MRNKFFPVIIFLAAGLLFSCTSPRQGMNPGEFRFNLNTEPPSLDWTIATDQASIWVLINLMEGLTTYNSKLEVIPAVAHSWDVLDGNRRYVFHLRRDVRWSDDVPVRAQDFVYSWQRLVDPATAAEYAYFLYPVKNAQKINSGKIRDTTRLGVKALDDYTLEVILEKPIVYFPAITTFMVTFPLRRDIIEKYGNTWTEPAHIVTNGPFRLAEWHHEYKLVLKRNPLYYAEPPGLDRVVFYMVNELMTALSLYETGALDMVDPLPQAVPFWRDSREYYAVPNLRCDYYGFNIKKPPVNDVRVRRALAMAIDKSRIPQILKQDHLPASSWLPRGMFAFNPEIGYPFNPEKAREILAEAGYPGGRGFPPITIAYNTYQTHKMVAEYVQQQWRQNLHIGVHIQNMEWKVFLKELQHDAPAVFRLGWGADYPDPDNFMRVFLSNSGNNHTNWANPEFDRLVEEAAVEIDPEKRQALYNRAQRMLLEQDCVIIPLFHYTRVWLIKPWVKGLQLNALDQLYLKSARITSK